MNIGVIMTCAFLFTALFRIIYVNSEVVHLVSNDHSSRSLPYSRDYDLIGTQLRSPMHFELNQNTLSQERKASLRLLSSAPRLQQEMIPASRALLYTRKENADSSQKTMRKDSSQLKALIRQPPRFYVTAAVVRKPSSQAVGEELFEMSFLLKNENLTQRVSDAIVSCAANASRTDPTRWGLFNTQVISVGIIQGEYFAFTTTAAAGEFRRNMTVYMTNGNLSQCVRKRDPDFSDTGSILSGRKIVPSFPNGARSEGGVKAWVVGAVVGAIALLSTVISLIVLMKRSRVYNAVVFDPEPKQLLTPEERQRIEDEELEMELKALAVDYRV